MILWISGPYGVGKSTLAEVLAGQLPGAMIFDAEAVGNAVRGNYPGEPMGVIFEDYPLWRVFCRQLLEDLYGRWKTVLVPMTLVRTQSYRDILLPMKEKGLDARLVILEAEAATLHDRILARGEEEDCWCMESIPLARAGSAGGAGAAFPWLGSHGRHIAMKSVVLGKMNPVQTGNAPCRFK